MIERLYDVLADDTGQTTIEWIVLSIMIGIAMVTIAVNFAEAMIEIFALIKEKIMAFAEAIGF